MRIDRDRRETPDAGADCGQLETMEPRVLLSGVPLPTLNDLQNRFNSVVRLQTNYGVIDIELFDNAAPITVQNFVGYVNRGDYDGMFFHRLVRDFVIQGGLARLGDDGQPENVYTAPSIQNEFNQSNLERTVAMARVGGQPNSANSQWFINLSDNTNLDTVDGGFTVFGRILGDASWDVVQTIAALPLQAFAAPYNELPISEDFDPSDGVQYNELVYIIDAEVIKGPGAMRAFYNQSIHHYGGIAANNTREFLTLTNPNNVSAVYQVILRFSAPQQQRTDGQPFVYRDLVVAEGRIDAFGTLVFTLSDFSNRAGDLVPLTGVRYAIEVRSTRPVNAVYRTENPSGTAIEHFTRDTDTTWGFADLWKRPQTNDVIMWANPGGEDANVTLTFIYPGKAPVVITLTTEAFRSGFINLQQRPELTQGRFSVRIESDTPIVAGHYRQELRGAQWFSTTYGVAGSGDNFSLVTSVATGADVNTWLSFANPGPSMAQIQLTFVFSDGRPDLVFTNPALMIGGNRRISLSLFDIPQLRNQGPVTVFYQITNMVSSGVYAHAMQIASGDNLSTPFRNAASGLQRFSNGFLDPARAGSSQFSTLSIYNPGGFPSMAATVTVAFRFADGTLLSQQFTVDAQGRLDIDLHSNSQLLQRISANPARQRFFIAVGSNTPVVAQLRFLDTATGGDFTLGVPNGPTVSIA